VGKMEDKPTLTIREVADLMGFNRMTITRMFLKERGVLVVTRPKEKHKRAYRSIRIPRYVYNRVIERLAVK
jgi:hypothetical protein